jgi:hypothetical protein
MPDGIPLVPCQLMRLVLDGTHVSTGHPPGTYAAIVMPRYIDSVARMTPGPDASGILLGGQRMIEALEYIHSLGLVHMDVKVSVRWQSASFLALKCCIPAIHLLCHVTLL